MAVIARRSGAIWFLGVLNGVADQAIDVELAQFLDAGLYEMLAHEDG